MNSHEFAPLGPAAGSELYGWLQLTNRCNLRCKYCYTESGPNAEGEYTYEQSIDILADLARLGCKTVMLSGGEPTVYPRIDELIDHACTELGLSVTLVSNGTRIRPELVDVLKRHNCAVQVSLDALNLSAYERIRGHTLLPKVLAALDTLIAEGVLVTLSNTLTKVNKDAVEDIVQYALDRGIQFVHFAPTYWKESGPLKERISITDLYPILKSLYDIQKKNFMFISIDLVESLVLPVALGIEREYYCNAMAGRTVEVASNGKAYFCAAQRDLDEMTIGEIDGPGSLFDIVKAARDADRFPDYGASSIQECLSCEYRSICAGGCRAMSLHQKGSLHTKHPNCGDLKRLIADIKADQASGAIDDYVAFLKDQSAEEGGADAMLKFF